MGARMPGRGEAEITAGEPIYIQINDVRELAELREQVRETIAKLCS